MIFHVEIDRSQNCALFFQNKLEQLCLSVRLQNEFAVWNKVSNEKKRRKEKEEV